MMNKTNVRVRAALSKQLSLVPAGAQISLLARPRFQATGGTQRVNKYSMLSITVEKCLHVIKY